MIAVFAAVAVVLIALNLVSHTQKQRAPDKESEPNRSSYNFGSTGTRAFYSLLEETGRKPMRWQDTTNEFVRDRRYSTATFVLVGPFREDFEQEETTALLKWVARGGTLVLIDRSPASGFLNPSADWQLIVDPPTDVTTAAVDPANTTEMIGSMPAVRPIQPSLAAWGINAVQPSKFAAGFEIANVAADGSETVKSEEEISSPLILLAGGQKNIAAKSVYGSGQIIYVGDPFIIANKGIGLADNAEFGMNVVRSGTAIVFDEFHHGYGSSGNQLLQYFSGTPIIAIVLQLCALALAFIWSQSRRFAKALPEDEPNRLSKLEYVSAMAELQRRTRAYDLAIESIYKDFRRRSARSVGLDNTSVSRDDLAAAIADRVNGDRAEISALMLRCEDIIYGDPAGAKETVRLAERLRKLEKDMGLKRGRGAN